MTVSTPHAILASTIFDGELCHGDCALIVEGADIVGVVPRGEVPASIPKRTLPDGAWLAPGFIDCQVNGGGDILFNDDPSVEGIAAIAKAHRRFGVTSI